MPNSLGLRTLRIDLQGKVVTPQDIRKALVPTAISPESERRIIETKIPGNKTENSPSMRLDISLSSDIRIFVDLSYSQDCVFIVPSEPKWHNLLGPIRIILHGISFPKLTRTLDQVAHTLKQELKLSAPVQGVYVMSDNKACDCSVCKQ